MSPIHFCSHPQGFPWVWHTYVRFENLGFMLQSFRYWAFPRRHEQQRLRMFLVQVTEQHQSHFPNLDQKTLFGSLLFAFCPSYSQTDQQTHFGSFARSGICTSHKATQVALQKSLSTDCNHRLKSSSHRGWARKFSHCNLGHVFGLWIRGSRGCS